MEAIGNLLRLRGSECSALGVKTNAVPRDHHRFGMLLEPGALGGSVRQEVDYAMQVQIDEDCPIVLAFAPCPIIHAEVINREPG